MQIRDLRWNDINLEHIGVHGVTPEEVEEVCYSAAALFTRAGRRRYQAIGQTEFGRFLTIFLDSEGKGSYYPVTARDADAGERRLWGRLRRR